MPTKSIRKLLAAGAVSILTLSVAHASVLEEDIGDTGPTPVVVKNDKPIDVRVKNKVKLANNKENPLHVKTVSDREPVTCDFRLSIGGNLADVVFFCVSPTYDFFLSRDIPEGYRLVIDEVAAIPLFEIGDPPATTPPSYAIRIRAENIDGDEIGVVQLASLAGELTTRRSDSGFLVVLPGEELLSAVETASGIGVSATGYLEALHPDE